MEHKCRDCTWHAYMAYFMFALRHVSSNKTAVKLAQSIRPRLRKSPLAVQDSPSPVSTMLLWKSSVLEIPWDKELTANCLARVWRWGGYVRVWRCVGVLVCKNSYETRGAFLIPATMGLVMPI